MMNFSFKSADVKIRSKGTFFNGNKSIAKLLMKEISNNKDKTYGRHIQNRQQLWDESLRIEKRGGMR